MVKTTKKTSFGKQQVRALNKMISYFGRTLTHRLQTITTNADGVITAISTSDNTFDGDLQYGLYLDKKLLNAGYVSNGEAVLYVSPDESQASTIDVKKSIIIEGVASDGSVGAWIVDRILEQPNISDDVMHYSFACKRIDNITL